jgi:hypothetical protein
VNGQFASEAMGAVLVNAGDVVGPATPAGPATHLIGSFLVTIQFAEALDRSTVEAAAWATDSGANFVSAELQIDGSTVIITFDANAGDGASGAMLTIPGTVTDINGNATNGGVDAMILIAN